MEKTATIRRTGIQPRPLARCPRSKAQPITKRTAGDNRNGFLSHTFLPVWLYNGDKTEIEEQFSNSVANYCTHFNVNLPDTDGLTFPQNIYQTWDRVKDACGDKHCIILQNAQHVATLATVQTLDLNHCLFYVPVRPYWRIAKCAEHQQLAELIMCLYAYLHQQAGLPFYMDRGTYIDSQYEMLEQWIGEVRYEEGYSENDEDNENSYRDAQEADIYELRQAGAHIHRLIDEPNWLNKMEAIITAFIKNNPTLLEWNELATDFLVLYMEYPNGTINDHITTELVCPGEEERITPEMYTGFYWSGSDNLNNDLDDMINNHFQEMPVMDEPMHIQFFDHLPLQPDKPFDFEDRLFDLIEKFRDLLNQYDTNHDEHNRPIQPTIPAF